MKSVFLEGEEIKNGILSNCNRIFIDITNLLIKKKTSKTQILAVGFWRNGPNGSLHCSVTLRFQIFVLAQIKTQCITIKTGEALHLSAKNNKKKNREKEPSNEEATRVKYCQNAEGHVGPTSSLTSHALQMTLVIGDFSYVKFHIYKVLFQK